MSDKIPYSLLRIPISFVPSNPLKSCYFTPTNKKEKEDSESFSNSLAKLLEYNDEEEEDIKHIEPIEDTIKTGKNNEYEEKFNSSDDKICFNDQSIPDPLTLNETNVGFRMLRDQGWRYEKGLGINEQASKDEIKKIECKTNSSTI
ncbi:unnamed protein product [Rhizophagus irregularis]|nr:unnamed protein product [Rhizophagus irregularis]